MNATLKIDSVEFTDRAEYTCEATNQFGSGNSTILVRVKGEKRVKLRRFALRFIHWHSDATSVFHEIVALTTSGNRVKHIVSFQDDAVAGLLGR